MRVDQADREKYLFRNFGFNFLETISKCGSALAPFVVDLGGELDPGLPFVVFGSLIFLAGFVFLLLPDTKDKPMPQTVGDVEKEFKKSLIQMRV